MPSTSSTIVRRNRAEQPEATQPADFRPAPLAGVAGRTSS